MVYDAPVEFFVCFSSIVLLIAFASGWFRAVNRRVVRKNTNSEYDGWHQGVGLGWSVDGVPSSPARGTGGARDRSPGIEGLPRSVGGGGLALLQTPPNARVMNRRQTSAVIIEADLVWRGTFGQLRLACTGHDRYGTCSSCALVCGICPCDSATRANQDAQSAQRHGKML